MPVNTIMRDTIFALSSGMLPSGVAVIRITGPASGEVLKRLTGHIPEPRFAKLCSLKDADSALIDRALCFYFPSPNSFTGEDCAEIQPHGGKAVVAKILSIIGSFEGLRSAEAGEFTKRAFLNGKINLTNAEALSDLISAETEAQRIFAISNSSDKHRQLYDSWREHLIHIRAYIEADLDFSDEDDVPASVTAQINRKTNILAHQIRDHISSYKVAEILRDGLQIVILGAPNAGKSSLLNALARRDVAIVTDEAGTTRDILEVQLDIGGLKAIIADTAGIREDPGKVEAIGIERSLKRAEDADLVLMVEDMTNPVSIELPEDKTILRIGNKQDLKPAGSVIYDCIISTETGYGLDKLIEELQVFGKNFTNRSTDTLPFRARHIDLLNEALSHIEQSLLAHDLELCAEQLRLSSYALSKICGEIDVEDLLDTIFSSFCIGK